MDKNITYKRGRGIELIATIVQLTLNGLMLGALYALAAVGLSLIFGIMNIVNLSHGSLLAIAVFITSSLYSFSSNVLATIIMVVFITFALGVIIEKGFVYPFRTSEMMVLVITFGVGKIIEQILYLVWGPTYITTPIYISGSLNFLGVTVSNYRLALFILSVILMLALWIFIQKSKWGKAIRAVAQDEEAALIYGVNVKQIRTFTFALASALAAVAGIFLSSIYMFQPASGWEYLLIALSITIVGGLGDVRGAVLASFILGIAETYIGYFISPIWRTVVYFLSIIVILSLKPSGLIGFLRSES